VSAFQLAMGAGVAYKALERVARATKQLAPLLDAQEALAQSLRDDEVRSIRLREAAHVALDDLGDWERGFRLLMEADELAKPGQLRTELLDAVHRWSAVDAAAAVSALASVAAAWEQRAERYWDAEIKLKLLTDTAMLHLRELHDAVSAVRVFSALFVPDVTSNFTPDAHAAALTTYAELLHAAGRSADARAALDEALTLDPDRPQVRAMRAALGSIPAPAAPTPSVEPAPTAPAEAEPATTVSEPVAAAEQPAADELVLAEADIVEEPPEPTEPSPQGRTRRGLPRAEVLALADKLPGGTIPGVPRPPLPAGAASKPPPAASIPPVGAHDEAPPHAAPMAIEAPRTEEVELRTRAETGDAQALAEWTALVSTDPGRRDEARHLLARLYRAEPFRTESLRQLHTDALAVGSRAEAAVSGAILSMFTPNAPRFHQRMLQPGMLRYDELCSLLDPSGHRDVDVLLATLWDNARAIPRFRRTLDSYEVGPRQRLSPSNEEPVAVAFAHIARLLSRTDVPVYLKPKAQAALHMVPTHPPTLIARADLQDEPLLWYVLGQSLWLSHPEKAVLCVVPEQDGRDLFGAMLGAFGPKTATAQLDRAGKELAAALWHTVPMRAQGQMREMIAAHAAKLDYDALRIATLLAGHRAGLLAVSDVRLALEAVAALEPALRDIDVHTQDGFRTACHQSQAFAEVIRTALGETYLALVAQTL
jgi:tetratricopeptide (TPR) repeat protein